MVLAMLVKAVAGRQQKWLNRWQMAWRKGLMAMDGSSNGASNGGHSNDNGKAGQTVWTMLVVAVAWWQWMPWCGSNCSMATLTAMEDGSSKIAAMALWQRSCLNGGRPLKWRLQQPSEVALCPLLPWYCVNSSWNICFGDYWHNFYLEKVIFHLGKVYFNFISPSI